MNLDRCCLLILVCFLPLLCLPISWLVAGLIGAGGLLVIALFRRDSLLFCAAVMVGISYFRVGEFAEKVQNQTAYKSQAIIQIRQILTQQDYQRAIAEREDGTLIMLNWQSETPLQLGRHYQVELNLRPLNGRLNEGNFNRQRWLLAHWIYAIASVKKATLLETPTPLRSRYLAHIKTATEGLNTQGIVLALAFGERAWLTPAHWQLFQQTATAHLIAISGLHIGLAFGIGFSLTKLFLWGIGWICFRLNRRQAVENPYFFALLGGFLTAWGYSFLAGFSVPTVRAMIAISLLLLCRLARRHFSAWQLWLRCVVLLLVLDPLSLLSDSFWLSVLAVACLIFWYQLFPLTAFLELNEWQKQANWRRFIVGLLHLQIGITLCFLPVQFYFFEGYSPFAFVANLVIVPLYSLLVVPLILVALMLGDFLPLWAIIDAILQTSLAILTPFSRHWQSLSFNTQWQWLGIDLFVLATLYFRQRIKTAFSLIAFATLVFMQLPKGWTWLSEPPRIEWLHFDVGQGLAMAFVYQTSGQKRAILYDTGAGWQGGSMAELEIIPYLTRHAIELEAIILSHDDNDHSGGIKPLLNAYPNARLILSGKNRYSNAIFDPCIQGKQWQFGELKLTAVYPSRLADRAKNQDSCVIVAEISPFRLLLTGDSGVAQEKQFAEQVGKIDFLQVGHHGSKNSTGYRLLSHTKPDYAIISAARFNVWKMPHSSILTRLKAFRVNTLNTAENGMIKVSFYATYYQINTARDPKSRWYKSYMGQ